MTKLAYPLITVSKRMSGALWLRRSTSRLY